MVSVLNTVDTAHEDMIHDAQVDFYGTRLATCSSDRSIKIFDIKSGSQILLKSLTGHDGPVWQISWAHPMYGTVLASCSYDRKVIIWKETNRATWANIFEYNNHDSSVNSVSWAPSEYGLVLACGSSDGAISILTYCSDGNWSTKKISNAHTIGCNSVSWAPLCTNKTASDGNGSQLAYVKRFASGGCDNLVKIWREKEDSGEWIEENKLEAHSDWVRDVAWAPSLGLGSSLLASCSQDRRVIIWTCDYQQGQTAWTYRVLNLFDDVVWNVSWSITGNILAVSGGDNKVTLWKESLEGQWVCISDVAKGQGQVKAVTGGLPESNGNAQNIPNASEA